jgi:hypothetical protein
VVPLHQRVPGCGCRLRWQNKGGKGKVKGKAKSIHEVEVQPTAIAEASVPESQIKAWIENQLANRGASNAGQFHYLGKFGAPSSANSTANGLQPLRLNGINPIALGCVDRLTDFSSSCEVGGHRLTDFSGGHRV